MHHLRPFGSQAGSHSAKRSAWRGVALPLALVVVAVLVLAAAMPAPASAEQPAPHRLYIPLAVNNPSALAATQRTIPPPDQVLSYVLRPGDDLTDLALELGRDVSTMACVTPSSTFPLSELRPGQMIVIPSSLHICHTVQPEQTLADIAALYRVEPSAIAAIPWNQLASPEQALEPGRRLLIYGGVRPDSMRRQGSAYPAPTATPTLDVWPYGDGHFIWPVHGVISQGFTSRHRGLDIAADAGVDVVAADNGTVIKAGWSEVGYGLRVIIDHNIDYITLYAHLNEVFVQEGQVVQKGQIIGRVGSTGNSTGPHLHFELRDFGYLVNPLRLLPD